MFHTALKARRKSATDGPEGLVMPPIIAALETDRESTASKFSLGVEEFKAALALVADAVVVPSSTANGRRSSEGDANLVRLADSMVTTLREISPQVLRTDIASHFWFSFFVLFGFQSK